MNIQLRNRLDKLFEAIEKSRVQFNPHHIVKIVAVTKYSNSEFIRNIYNIGQRAIGENKVQDLEKKVNELNDLPIEWHFIGSLQKNKINKLLSLRPALIQSVDSLKIAEDIDLRAKKLNLKVPILLQINSSREPQKSGVEIEKAIDIYQEIQEKYSSLQLKGVMTISKKSENLNEVRKPFQETYKIFEVLQKNGAQICSMGMSNDFEIAIQEGSNMIRIGKIFQD
jgi:pyridoxal phosphate enzyme (YggS family)